MKKEIKVLIAGVAILIAVFLIGVFSLLNLNRKNISKNNDEYKNENESDLQKRLSDLYYGKVTDVKDDEIEISLIMKGLEVVPEKERTKMKFKTTDATQFKGSCLILNEIGSEAADVDGTDKPATEGDEETTNVSGGGDSEDVCGLTRNDLRIGSTVTVKEAEGFAVSVKIN